MILYRTPWHVEIQVVRRDRRDLCPVACHAVDCAKKLENVIFVHLKSLENVIIYIDASLENVI